MTASDESERIRYLMRKFGHDRVIDLSHAFSVVAKGTPLTIPTEYIVKDKRGLLNVPASLRLWVESACDGAGYYKTSENKFEYFIPVYGAASHPGKNVQQREMPPPLGLISLSSLARAKKEIKIRRETPVYSVSSRACKPGYYPNLSPIEPEGDGVAVTSGFGFRERDRRHHSGVDIQAPKDTPIRASAKGTVTAVDYRARSAGYFVAIDHGRGIQTVYAHLAKGSLTVKPGDQVQAGQIIARVGNSGRVRGKNGGYHLHFELRQNGVAINPERGYSLKPFTDAIEDKPPRRTASLEK